MSPGTEQSARCAGGVGNTKYTALPPLTTRDGSTGGFKLLGKVRFARFSSVGGKLEDFSFLMFTWRLRDSPHSVIKELPIVLCHLLILGPWHIVDIQ